MNINALTSKIMHIGSSVKLTPRRQTMFGCLSSDMSSASLLKSEDTFCVAPGFRVLMATKVGPVDAFTTSSSSPLKTFPKAPIKYNIQR